MGPKFVDRFIKPLQSAFVDIIKHPLSRFNALRARGRVSAEWQGAFVDYARANTVDKLVLFTAALWAVQAATVIWHIVIFAVGAIGVFGFIFRLALSVIFLAVMSAMNSWAVRGEAEAGARGKPEYMVLLYIAFMTLGQIAFAALDQNAILAVYRLIVTAVMIAILPDLRSEKFIATTGGLYTSICAAVILIPRTGDYAPLEHLPAVVLSVAGAEFVCLFVRSHVVTAFIHQKTMEDAKDRLESANKTLVTVNESLEKLSTTDQLTQVSNRRAFDEYIARVWNECRRLNKPLSVLMMDIDHFKAFNDFYGHVEGDECLKTVADCGRKHFNRAVDMFARYGGEEFVAVLPFTSADSALRLAEATRSDVEALHIPNPHNDSGPYVTLSIGCATEMPEGDDHSAVVEKADKALYEAKETGRNRVVSDRNLYTKAHAKVADVHGEFEEFRAALIKEGAAALALDLKNGAVEFSKEFVLMTGITATSITLEEFYKYMDGDGAGMFRELVNRVKSGAPIGFPPRFMLITPEGRMELSLSVVKPGAGKLLEDWAFGVVWNEDAK